MRPALSLKCFAVVVAGLGVTTAQAATVWDESVSGDLSNNGLSPSSLAVSVGSNVVLGTVGDGGQGIDRDYFKFTVPPGAVLKKIVLQPNVSVSGGASFIGIQPGPQLTVTPTGLGVEQFIAFGHYTNDLASTDLLPSLEVGTPGPLPSGTYSVWVQDTGGPAAYGFDFVIASVAAASAPAVPEWGLVLLGVLLASVACQRIGRSHRDREPEI